MTNTYSINKELNTKLKNYCRTLSKDRGQTIFPSQIVKSAISKYLKKKEHLAEWRSWRANNIQKIYDRDAGLCLYCHQSVSLEEATLDHLTPLSRGGQACSLSNVTISCYDCNWNKSCLTAEEYISVIFSK